MLTMLRATEQTALGWPCTHHDCSHHRYNEAMHHDWAALPISRLAEPRSVVQPGHTAVICTEPARCSKC